MNPATRLLAALLRLAVRGLPADRRDWGAALWAETGEVPPGWPRWRWLAGGVRLVVREARIEYRLAHLLVFAAGVAGVEWLRRTGGLPTTAIVAAGLIGSAMMVLPWTTRRSGRLGPVAATAAARSVRLGGYAAIIVLVVSALGAARYASRRFADDPSHHGGGGEWVLVVLLLVGYVAGILAATARGSGLATTTVAMGAGCGAVAGVAVYALAPFAGARHLDNPWLAAAYVIALLVAVFGGPVAASLLVVWRTRPPESVADPDGVRIRQGAAAGTLAGGALVLVLGALTITTLMLAPHNVALEWANPDPSVPHGTPFEVQMSVGDSVLRYLGYLVLGPLGGLLFSGAGLAAIGTNHQPAAD